MANATPFTPDQDWGRPVPPVVFSDAIEPNRYVRQADPVPIPAFWIEPDPAAGSHLYHD